MGCFRLLLERLAWIEHQFLSGIRDSRKAGSLWEMLRGVARVRKSIHQSWLAKGLGLLCWGLKGVQKEILSEVASTLQIGSVAFPPGQCTSSQLHPIWPRWISRQPLSLRNKQKSQGASSGLSWSNSLWQGWSCGLVHCPGGNAPDPIWRVLASSDGISSWTPFKPQHNNPNPFG